MPDSILNAELISHSGAKNIALHAAS